MNFLVSLDSEIPQNFVVAVLDYCLQLVPILLLFPCYSILLAIFDWIYVLNQSCLCSCFFWTNLLITCLLFSSAFLYILHLLFFFFWSYQSLLWDCFPYCQFLHWHCQDLFFFSNIFSVTTLISCLSNKSNLLLFLRLLCLTFIHYSRFVSWGIGTVFSQKNHTRKTGNIHKYFKVNQVFIHNFLCQNLVIFLLNILLTRRTETFWPKGIKIFFWRYQHSLDPNITNEELAIFTKIKLWKLLQCVNSTNFLQLSKIFNFILFSSI